MKLDLSKESEKTLLEVDNNTAGRMIKAIIKLPDGDIRPLKGHTPLFRLRLGNWRVIFRIIDEDGITVIKRIGPRGNVYDNL
jgi:mRNA interferase RelE/StbE